MLSSLFLVVQDIHCCIMSLGYERGGVVKILVKCVCMGGVVVKVGGFDSK